MIQSGRCIRHVLCLLAFSCAATICRAQSSPFNGVWHTDLSQTRFSPQPDSFYVAGGWYHCVNCHPPFAVPADGRFHAVIGQAYDSLCVRVDDPNAITVTAKENGNIDFVQTRTLLADGDRLHLQTTVYQNGNEPVTYSATCRRQGPTPSGVQPTSGKWVLEKVSGSRGAMTVKLRVTGNQLTMTGSEGESFTAQMDGKAYPVNGSDYFNAIALRQISPDTIEATEMRDGKVVGKNKATVRGDTMTVTATVEPSGRTTTFVAHKI